MSQNVYNFHYNNHRHFHRLCLKNQGYILFQLKQKIMKLIHKKLKKVAILDGGNVLNLLLYSIFLKIRPNSNVHPKYSKVSITRPGRSRLLEFEKNIVLVV